jgi:hypothetical protein
MLLFDLAPDAMHTHKYNPELRDFPRAPGGVVLHIVIIIKSYVYSTNTY